MFSEGQKASEFALQADEGRKVSLSDSQGKKTVLYFYPKDGTPGCTRARICFPIYDRLRNNAYNNRFDMLSLDEKMLLLLGILSSLLLATGATFFLVYRLCKSAFEETKREELQKLISECTE